MSISWDHEYEAVVVGTGNGGLTAAVCLHEMGVKNVLIIEKSAKIGGTSALSGGGVWIPNNRYAVEAGADDSIEEARKYLTRTVPDDVRRDEMIEAYITQGPKMIDFLHDRTRVRYESLEMYPDYYNNYEGSRTGHRSMEPEPFDITNLGKNESLLMGLDETMSFFGKASFTQKEAHVMVTKHTGWRRTIGKLMVTYFLDLSRRLAKKPDRRLTCGVAGVGRLYASVLDRNIPIWRETALTELIEEDGRIVGLSVTQDGKNLNIKATEGVVLAAGGFEHNQAKREQYLPAPTNSEWSAGHFDNQGDAIWAAETHGAATRQMDGAWWCSSLKVPGMKRPMLSIIEKSLPGSIVVNQQGKRYSNESQNYMAFMLEMFERHTDENPCHPSWMVFDNRFHTKYRAGPLMPRDRMPEWAVPKKFYETGFLTKADTIEELAQKAGIESGAFQETITNFNQYAKDGKDPDFQRGDTAYDRYYGDEAVTPNPCLAPLDQGPYYAMRMDPGDFGTHGGLHTDPNGQVLNQVGEPIGGMYAVGNCCAAVLPTYPGPGSTLGPAMTFGYQAAKHIAGWNE